MIDAVRWLATVEILGLAILPISLLFFRFLPDRGFIFAKSLGLLLITFLVWIVGSFLPVAREPWLAAAFVLALATFSWWYAGSLVLTAISSIRVVVAIEEGIFVVAFAVWCLMRVYVFHPAISHTEQFMDMALLNAAYHSASYPTFDPWMSGHTVNYYYLGYLAFATVSKLSSVVPSVAYNLSISLIFALVLASAYSIGYALCRRRVWACLAPVAVALAGNWHAVLVQLPTGHFPGNSTWWFWDSTRVVASQGDYTINEFPYFSFVLGDLHPHVMELPFVFLAIASAVNLLYSPARERSQRVDVWRYALLAVILGSLFATNSWDYPTFFILVAAAMLAHAYLTDAGSDWWRRPLMAILALGAASLLLFAPFYLHFRSLAHGIGLVSTRSDIWQFIQVFGPALVPVTFLIGALAILLQPAEEADISLPLASEGGNADVGFASGTRPSSWVAVGVIAAIAILGIVLHAWTLVLVLGMGLGAATILERVLNTEEPNRADAIALILVILACLIIAFTEVGYLRDSFDGSASYRMNTVFKFYYEAWVMLGLAGAYGIWRAWTTASLIFPPVVALVTLSFGLLAMAGGLVYTILAPQSAIEDFGDRSLNGMAWIQKSSPADYAGIQWLSKHASPETVVLEATGDEYSTTARVATFTGLPTVMGWAGHENQWRGADPEIGSRVNDVRTIYTSSDIPLTRRLLDRYHVGYVFIGSEEHQAFGGTKGHLDKFSRFMRVAFHAPGVTIYVPKR